MQNIEDYATIIPFLYSYFYLESSFLRLQFCALKYSFIELILKWFFFRTKITFLQKFIN